MGYHGSEVRPDWGGKSRLDPNSFYREVFISAPFAVLLFRVGADGSFVCEKANAAAAKLANRSFRAMLGRAPRAWLPKEVSDNLEAKLRQCADSGLSVTYDMAHDSPCGRISWTT